MPTGAVDFWTTLFFIVIPQLYGARSVPSTFIIDRSGVLRAIALGPRNWDGKAAFAYIETLLKDGKPRG